MTQPAKVDRRMQRTRQLLGDALVELMLEKAYDDISVQDILDRANVGRSTFYAHYTDKENLLVSQLARLLHLFAASTHHSEQPPADLFPSLALFRHVQEQRRLVQAFIWGRGADLLQRLFREQVSQIVERNLRALAGGDWPFSVPITVASGFVANTFLMLLQWWFAEDMRHTPEQMDAMFQTLVTPGVQAIMQSPDRLATPF